jgi:hypothetical protein
MCKIPLLAYVILHFFIRKCQLNINAANLLTKREIMVKEIRILCLQLANNTNDFQSNSWVGRIINF